MESSPVADQVAACLIPKGWVRRNGIADPEYGIRASEFSFMAAHADVTVIFDSVGSVLTQELVVKTPGSYDS